MDNTESIFKNKKFIKASIACVAILALFILALFVNEVKESRYLGGYGNTITVIGDGEVSAIPDIAVIDISLSKEAPTAEEATKLLNESIAATLEYLKGQEIVEKDIKSEYGGINPKYERDEIYCITYPCPQGKTKIVAYTAMQNINIKIRVADNANKIRSGLADLGITNITGPSFSIDDEDLLKEEARSLAIIDAKAKAKKLSKDLGIRLGKVVSFYEEGDDMYPMMYAEKSSMMAGADINTIETTPTLPKGENKIFSKVNITYEIR